MIQGIGTDIVEVSRIAKAMKRWKKHFLTHVFSEEEIEYCNRHKFSAEHFAGRFTAKEAIIKALPDTTNLEWKDIKILNHENGKPYCILNKKKIKGTIHISISHTRTYATAFAIIAS